MRVFKSGSFGCLGSKSESEGRFALSLKTAFLVKADLTIPFDFSIPLGLAELSGILITAKYSLSGRFGPLGCRVLIRRFLSGLRSGGLGSNGGFSFGLMGNDQFLDLGALADLVPDIV